MATYPPIAKAVIEADRVISVTITKPVPANFRAGRVRLDVDSMTKAITFGTALPDTSWVMNSLVLENSGDAAVDLQFLQIMMVTQRSASGFTVRFSAPIPTDNYWLHWSVTGERDP